ncbi:MAG TPA: hypothetical protein VL986_14495 [Terracidiphilus sp.]|nr:hypothetical protein [Terracidiphilus sp.]
MRYLTVFFAVLLLVPELLLCQAHLKPVKQIGVGWQTDKWGWMSYVAFNHDGTLVASDGATAPDDVSGNLSFWTFPEGRLSKKIAESPAELSNDWRYYASSREVVEIATGRRIVTFAENDYPIVAFSPDSRYLAESISGKGLKEQRIKVIELSSGRQVSSFGQHQVFSMAISPDGTTLASGYWNVVALWNPLSGNELGTLEGFGRYVGSLSFSPDGKWLAASTDFGGVELWNLQTRARLWTLKFDGGYVSQPAFSHDGKLLAVGVYGTGTLWLIDAGAGKILDQQRISDLGCGSAAFSPDDRYLIAPSTGGLIKWPYDRGGTIRVFEVTQH